MDDLLHGPVLVVDDGSATAVAAFERAVPLASSITVASVAGSRNEDALRAAAASARVVTDVVRLEAHTGIRHAIELCGPRRIAWVVVPLPEDHPGRLLRKCVQAAAAIPHTSLPALTVHLVAAHSSPTGPVLEVNRSSARAGFVSLAASRLAVTTGAQLSILDLGPAGSAGPRMPEAAAAADELRRVHQLVVHPVTVDAEGPAAATWAARGTRAAVVGLGGFTAGGRKLGSPDELGDEILRSPDGRVAHELARQAASDVVVVIDEVVLER